MRKFFEEPTVEVTKFDVEDIVTVSQVQEEEEGWGGGRG